MALLGTGNGDGYYGGAFKRVVSKVDWDENKRDGWIIYPDENERWLVACEPLSARDGAMVLRTHTVARDAIDVARGACETYAVAAPNERKKGDSVIRITFAVKNGVVVQIYVLQKKLWYVIEFDYAGSPRLVPLVDALFNADSVYCVNLAVVAGDQSFQAEASAWWAVVMFLGADRAELCMQMPIGRMPTWGLSPALEKAIRALLRAYPRHKAKQLLKTKPGERIPLGVRKIGKMDPIAAEAHLEATNEGLERNGHAPVGHPDNPGQLALVQYRFGAPLGPTPRASWGAETQFGTARAPERYHGGRAVFGDNWDERDPDALALRWPRIYYLILNEAFHCAATDARPAKWLARLLTRTKLARPALTTFKFSDTLGGSGPNADRLQTLRIVGARDTGLSGQTLRRFVVDIEAEDGTVAEWPVYDACVALKLIGPTTRPPLPPGHGTYTAQGIAFRKLETLAPWPDFRSRRRSKRIRR